MPKKQRVPWIMDRSRATYSPYIGGAKKAVATGLGGDYAYELRRNATQMPAESLESLEVLCEGPRPRAS